MLSPWLSHGAKKGACRRHASAGEQTTGVEYRISAAFTAPSLDYTPVSFSGLQPTIGVTTLTANSTYPGGHLEKATTSVGGEQLEFTPATIPAAVDTI